MTTIRAVTSPARRLGDEVEVRGEIAGEGKAAAGEVEPLADHVRRPRRRSKAPIATGRAEVPVRRRSPPSSASTPRPRTKMRFGAESDEIERGVEGGPGAARRGRSPPLRGEPRADLRRRRDVARAGSGWTVDRAAGPGSRRPL